MLSVPLESDVVHGHRRAHRETLQRQISSSAFWMASTTLSKLVGERGFLPESVAASKGVGIFVERRITILSAEEFQGSAAHHEEPSADERHGNAQEF